MTPVRQFHETFDLTIHDVPTVPSDTDIRLRIRLIKEETEEVVDELVKLLRLKKQSAPAMMQLAILRNVLGELCDLRYVTEGTAVTLGLPLDEAYEAVHEANMAKVWPDGEVHRDAGGKVIKPPGHEPADMAAFVHVVESTAD